jgi:hypothetical protein
MKCLEMDKIAILSLARLHLTPRATSAPGVLSRHRGKKMSLATTMICRRWRCRDRLKRAALRSGGRGGIRTHGEFNPTFDFESSALNRTQPPFHFSTARLATVARRIMSVRLPFATRKAKRRRYNSMKRTPMMHVSLESDRGISDLSRLLAIERENAGLRDPIPDAAHKEPFADD